MLKRVFDFILSGILLFLFSLLILVIAILVKLDSKGDIIYKAERAGKNNKRFEMYKFRSMISEADKVNIYSTSTDDIRITKIGKILRKYKLDELPQLINILKGDMSFVGPRPEVKYYTDKFDKKEKEILSVKPGIVDFASIKFKDEGEILAKSNIKDKNKAYEQLIWPEKKRLQLKYVGERNFWLDIKIILNTLSCLLK